MKHLIDKNEDDFLLTDDFFNDLDTKSSIPIKSWVKKISIAAGVLTSVFLFSLLSYWVFDLLTYEKVEHPFVFFEVRALDINGHPVAGAIVKLDDDLDGITDSFGEWRRYVRYPLGSTVKIRVRKQTSKGWLEAKKNVKVPEKPKRDSEPEVKMGFQLVNKGTDINNPTRRKSAEVKRGKDRNMDFPTSNQKSSIIITADTKTNSQRKVIADPFDEISIEFQKKFFQSLSNKQLQQYRKLKYKITEELEDHASNLGLNINPDSTWKLKLAYIPTPKNNGLIKSTIEWHNHNSLNSAKFLKNFNKTPYETAINLLNTAKAYIPKGYHTYLEEDNWYVIPSKKDQGLWKLKAGELLKSETGHYFTIDRDNIENTENRYRVMVSDILPCQNTKEKDQCFLFKPTIKDSPPKTGWSFHEIKVLGKVPNSLEIYVSNYLAEKISPRIWKYWGKQNQKQIVKVLRGTDIIQQKSIRSSTHTIPFITIPKSNLAYSKH